MNFEFTDQSIVILVAMLAVIAATVQLTESLVRLDWIASKPSRVAMTEDVAAMVKIFGALAAIIVSGLQLMPSGAGASVVMGPILMLVFAFGAIAAGYLVLTVGALIRKRRQGGAVAPSQP